MNDKEMQVGDLVRHWSDSPGKKIGLVVARAPLPRLAGDFVLVLWQGDYGRFWTREEDLIIVSSLEDKNGRENED